jgi:hypothetical protein
VEEGDAAVTESQPDAERWQLSYPRQRHGMVLMRVISCLTIHLDFVVAAAAAVEELCRGVW